MKVAQLRPVAVTYFAQGHLLRPTKRTSLIVVATSDKTQQQ
ncbi:MAG: hypothetical protein WBB28_23165 [Crinalium sp.]